MTKPDEEEGKGIPLAERWLEDDFSHGVTITPPKGKGEDKAKSKPAADAKKVAADFKRLADKK